jgi:hypothetical protein
LRRAGMPALLNPITTIQVKISLKLTYSMENEMEDRQATADTDSCSKIKVDKGE